MHRSRVVVSALTDSGQRLLGLHRFFFDRECCLGMPLLRPKTADQEHESSTFADSPSEMLKHGFLIGARSKN
jgi:hypothetical protein